MIERSSYRLGFSTRLPDSSKYIFFSLINASCNVVPIWTARRAPVVVNGSLVLSSTASVNSFDSLYSNDFIRKIPFQEDMESYLPRQMHIRNAHNNQVVLHG